MGRNLCPGCLVDLPLITDPCPGCGLPLAGSSGARCGACLQRRWSFEQAWVPFRYAFPVDAMVKALKFGGDLAAARELASLMMDARPVPRRPDCLVPVPLSAARLRQRGFNQSGEVAAHLSAMLGVPLVDACRRGRDTAPQASLAAAARRANVRDAFAVLAANAVRGARVAIVDDVVTTGQTAEAVARALRQAGVSAIELWAPARALPDR